MCECIWCLMKAQWAMANTRWEIIKMFVPCVGWRKIWGPSSSFQGTPPSLSVDSQGWTFGCLHQVYHLVHILAPWIWKCLLHSLHPSSTRCWLLPLCNPRSLFISKKAEKQVNLRATHRWSTPVAPATTTTYRPFFNITSFLRPKWSSQSFLLLWWSRPSEIWMSYW